MFKSLMAHTTSSRSDEVFASDLANALLNALPDVPVHRSTRMLKLSNQNDLHALTKAIENHGAPLALLAFANHNGVLGSLLSCGSALENLSADASKEQAKKIVADLKTLCAKFDDDLSQESLVYTFIQGFIDGSGGVANAISSLVSVALSLASIIVGVRKMIKWKKEEKEKRIANVLPYTFLVEHLKAIKDAGHVCKMVEALTLPKTQEEWVAFQKHVDSLAAPLSKLGVHVSGENVKTDDIPMHEKENIELLGYRENSLAEISHLCEEPLRILEGMKHNRFENFDRQLKAADKDSRKHVAAGLGLAIDVYETTVRRITKILHLTEATVAAIKHFYKTA